MATTLIGTPINRVDGKKKVTGTAQYASEFVLAGTTYGLMVDSAIAGGRIRRIDTAKAEKAPGVLLVLTHKNRGWLGKMPQTFEEGGATAESRAPLEDDNIAQTGQAVAFLVAETMEQARYAVALLEIDYEPGPFAVAMEESSERFQAEEWMHEPADFERGDITAGLRSADVRVSERYTTPNEHPCALEPHASIASWSGETLTLYNSTQWISGDQKVLAAAFNVPAENIRVLCPFTGGMFGSKAAVGSHTLLAAVASKKLNRPVKAELSRMQVLLAVGHRTETVQDIRLGATHDGKITALHHDVTSHVSLKDDFIEFASVASRMLYDVSNYRTSHQCVRLNVVKPGWMRAPGEAPGQFALESAMDELAYKLAMDPLELRRRNHAAVNRNSGKPFSSKHLLDCYERGAMRFGWEARHLQPRAMREGNTLIGWGMATATYPGYTMGAQVKVRLERGSEGVRAIVSTGGSDVGTGIYTMLTITAAEELALPLAQVSVELGDSKLAPCALAGGSNLTSSTAPATKDACTEIKSELLKIASETADGFTGATERASEFIFRNGAVSHRSNSGTAIRYEDLLSASRREAVEGNGRTSPIFGQNDRFAFQSFGAHFVEVRVREEIGRIRVSRIVSVFDCGRIMSAKTARSQFMGGIVFGIGMGLMEELTYERVRGQAINADLAGYLVPVNADVPEIDISWIDEPDYNFNSMGVRGIGEIGITGVAAAIANAVFHATGKRIRDLPITPEKLLHA